MSAANRKPEISPSRSVHRWFRFSLGTLFIVLTIGCVWGGWIANRAQNQRRAVEMVNRHGGSVYYHHQDPLISTPTPTPGPQWVRELLGIDYVACVTRVHIGEGTKIDLDRVLPGDDDICLLRGLPDVLMVDVSPSTISDVGCRHLATLPSLRMLRLRQSKVTDEGLRELCSLRNLDALTLDETGIGNDGLAHLAKCPALTNLSLTATLINDDGLAHLAPLSLDVLWLSKTRVTDAGLIHLAPHANLRVLMLNGTQVTSAAIPKIVKFTQLERLSLRDTQITDENLELLAQLSRLESLDVGGFRVSKPAYLRLKAKMPQCHVVF